MGEPPTGPGGILIAVRLPLSKVYRAFPELDGFTDAECESYVRHVSRSSGWRISMTAFVVALLCMFGLPLLFCMGAPLIRGRPARIESVLAVLVVAGLFTGPLWGFICRDVLLRRAIRERIKSAACPGCGYSLIGLKVTDGRVVCPECGGDVDLDRHDLSESDLVAERA